MLPILFFIQNSILPSSSDGLLALAAVQPAESRLNRSTFRSLLSCRRLPHLMFFCIRPHFNTKAQTTATKIAGSIFATFSFFLPD